MSHYEQLIQIMARLRSTDGCPWDKEQTHKTLKPYLIEETYEVIDAIDKENDNDLVEELGDVLLQVVFHAQIATEENRFTMEDIAQTIAEKLIRRHPHVFGNTTADTPEQVIQNWEKIKKEEKSGKKEDASVLSGVPKHLPALLRAYQIQKKAARVGFDWERAEEVLDKLKEEIEELKQAKNPAEQQEELGDVLFSIVNLSRFLNTDPEQALTQTIEKFIDRFNHIETELNKQGKAPQEATLQEMDELWEQAKEV